MAENNVLEVSPNLIQANEENPRVIFREGELLALQSSISERGILVPLTVFRSGSGYTILDGERRWRCALRLGLAKVPIIVQPKPDRLTNIMMMFAIHKARNDWDPLPTAFKLEQLEVELRQRYGRAPKERDLAAAASLSVGEIRRYRKISAMPDRYKARLMKELEKPRSEQKLTVDVVLETSRGAEALHKRGIVSFARADALTDAIVDKYLRGIEKNTVSPRKLPKIAQAYDRDEVTKPAVLRVVDRLISDNQYTIDMAFAATAEFSQSEKTVFDAVSRFATSIERHLSRHTDLSEELQAELARVRNLINRLLGLAGDG